MARKRQNGEGSIGQRKDGSWMWVYTTGVKPDGKPDRHWVYGRTAAEVREKKDKILAQRQEGTFVEPSRATVAQWMETWLSTYVNRPDARLTTVDEYERAYIHRIKPYLGGNKLQKLRGDQVQKWVNQLSTIYAPATVRGAHKVLKVALKQAIKNQLIAFNPAQDVILPKQDGHIKNPAAPLSEEDQDKLLAALLDNTCGHALAFMVFTGLRVGECCALTWDCVDDDSIRVRQTVQRVRNREGGDARTAVILSEPKTDAGRRTIPLTPSAKAIIDKQRTQAEAFAVAFGTAPLYVFATSKGNAVAQSSLTNALRDACQRAGIARRGLHDLRHTFGTRLNERGADVNTIARLMGHSSPTVTMRIYIHASDDHLRRAMDLLEPSEQKV